MAGGLGTRMRAAHPDVPKVMLPVRGKPLLEHQVLWLKSQGFSDITLCLGYKADAVKAHFGDTLRYAVENEPRGTAGCVTDLKLKEDALIVYGDLFPDLELKPLLRFHEKARALATLVLLKTDHPRDSDLAELNGDFIERIYRGGPGDLALAAVWIVTPALMKDAKGDFGRDVFPAALARGERLAGCVMQGTLADLGTPERLAAFEARA